MLSACRYFFRLFEQAKSTLGGDINYKQFLILFISHPLLVHQNSNPGTNSNTIMTRIRLLVGSTPPPHGSIIVPSIIFIIIQNPENALRMGKQKFPSSSLTLQSGCVELSQKAWSSNYRGGIERAMIVQKYFPLAQKQKRLLCIPTTTLIQTSLLFGNLFQLEIFLYNHLSLMMSIAPPTTKYQFLNHSQTNWQQ